MIMFAGKQDILSILIFFRRDFTKDNVSDTILYLAAMDIKASLVGKHIRYADIDPLTDPDVDFLKAAEICFYMEHAGMTRQIENTFGIVTEKRVGNYSTRYGSDMPMFFFAQGSAGPFLELLPHETWRMRGYKYVKGYVDSYVLNHPDIVNPYARQVFDMSDRGYGADIE